MKEQSKNFQMNKKISLRDAFGSTLVNHSNKFPNLIVLDADLAAGTGLNDFRKQYPKKFIQCGIAEQNMASIAGGIASMGKTVIINSFSIFLLRALEQIRLSIAYSNLNVKIIGGHTGIDVGPDGASAQCIEDIACFRSLPNMTVIAPCDSIEMEKALLTILRYKKPVYLRSGRSPIKQIFPKNKKFKIGKGTILRDGKDLTLVACGIMTSRCIEAAEIVKKKYKIDVRVVNMSSIKPIDRKLIIQSARKTKLIISCEDANIIGGLGGAISEVLTNYYPAKLIRIGVNDQYGESGDPEQLIKKYKIDTQTIIKKILKEKKGEI